MNLPAFRNCILLPVTGVQGDLAPVLSASFVLGNIQGNPAARLLKTQSNLMEAPSFQTGQMCMGEGPLNSERWEATPVFWHVVALLLIMLFALWLRPIPAQTDPALQGYLQVVTGLLAFVFSAVTLVRFQGTQDRISLILGAGFLLSGTALTATSVLFFQFLPDATLRLAWAPIAWWIGRMVLALLLVVALLVERFIPRSRHPRREIAGALLTVIALTYALAETLRRLPPEVSPHPSAFFPNP